MQDIKLINKDTVLPQLHLLNWDVYINDRPYYVVKIDGYVHTIGGKYGENCYWAYPRDEEPCYENLIEFNCGNPVAWGIEYKPRNYSKCKWDECEALSGSTIMITRNGKAFCDVFARGINYGIDKARVMISSFKEHPAELNSIDFDKKLIGRKVWWRSEPGVITHYCNGQACVIIKPDGIKKFTTPAEFAKEDDGFYYEDGDVKADILDKHIWWFRD